MRPCVLVTDGEERAALALVRSLGRAGFAVDVVASRPGSLAGSSRFADAEFVAPDPLLEPELHRTTIRNLMCRRGTRVLIPTSEAALHALLPLQDEVEGVEIPFPPLDTFARISNKAHLLEVARSEGIAVPEQWVVPCREDMSWWYDLPAFPLVMKPARSVCAVDPIEAAPGGMVKTRVLRVRDRGELLRRIRALPAGAFPLLLQQEATGPGVGIFLQLHQGELVAAFAHRRIREKPPSGGVSVFRESIPADPDLVDCSKRLLERFHWNGVAMVEYKLDREGGVPLLMEVNGRFWGSLQLAVDAGVDFPALLVRSALGEAVRPVRSYRTGMRLRWWWGEIDHLIAVLRQGEEGAGGGSSRPRSRAAGAALRGWLTPGRNEVFRWTDPFPSIRETREWFGRIGAAS